MKKFPKMKIHPLLLPLCLLYILQGQCFLFLAMFFFVTLHELGHCVTALLFGANVKQIWFTPIGERAVIKGLENISFFKRQIVFCAGSAVSLLLGLLLILFSKGETMTFFASFNLLLCGFNLMPFLPLDGGNILLHWAGRKYGILNAAGILVKVSRGFGYFLMLAGLLQVIFYPFNISLLLIGCYIVYSNKKEYLHITYQTYRALLAEQRHMKLVQQVYTKRDVTLGELVAAMSFDTYFWYCSMTEGKVEWKSQREVMELLLKKGAGGNVWG